MERQYWIIRNGESLGPFTMDELRGMGITPDTKVWFVDLKDWTPAGELSLFDSLFAATPEQEPQAEEVQAETAAEESEEKTTPEETAENADSPVAEEIQEETPENNHPGTVPPHFNSAAFHAQQHHTTASPFDVQNAYLAGYRKGLEESRQLDKDDDTSVCPPTNLVWAILSLVLCCLPLGIVAVVYASRVHTLYNSGEYLKAKRASDRAAYWSLASAIVWLVLYPIYATLMLCL